MDTTFISIGIAGASGKFGRSLVATALRDPGVRIACGVGSSSSPHLGHDLGILAGKEEIGVLLTSNYDALFEESTLIIDVSLATNLENMLTGACQKKKPLLIGTTGHDEKNLTLMKQASQHIPLFYASNFSLGVAAMTRAASLLSRMLGETCAIAIAETHHIHKKDRPSGTALGLALAMKNASGKEPVSINSQRIGDVIGDHNVNFLLEEEQVTLSHRALSRAIFAKGALCAAKFLAKQSPGFYSMDQLLQEKEEAYAPCKN